MLYILYIYYFFFFGSTARHAELPQLGIEPMPPTVEAQSLNHWTTRETQKLYILTAFFSWVLRMWSHFLFVLSPVNYVSGPEGEILCH